NSQPVELFTVWLWTRSAPLHPTSDVRHFLGGAGVLGGAGLLGGAELTQPTPTYVHRSPSSVYLRRLNLDNRHFKEYIAPRQGMIEIHHHFLLVKADYHTRQLII